MMPRLMKPILVRSIFVPGLLALVSILLIQPRAHAGLDVFMDLDNATILSDGDLREYSTLNGGWTQQRFNWQTKSPNPASKPTIVDLSGWGKALRFDLPGTPNNFPNKGSTDKTELDMVPVYGGNGAMFRNDPNYPGDYYVGFSVRFASEYWLPNPSTDTMFWQMWQGSPYSPPLTLTMPTAIQQNDGKIRAQLWRRDDTTGYFHGDQDVVDTYTFDRQKWYDIILRLKPSYNGDSSSGLIYVYINGQKVTNENNIDFGYNPDGPEDPTVRMASLINLYRGASPQRARIFFDNFRYGNDGSAVFSKIAYQNPEPGSLALLGVAGLCLLGRRRCRAV